MRHKVVVIQSINFEDELRCVDIFSRADGSYGFRECRRDPEDNRGWYELGSLSSHHCASAEDAMEEAIQSIGWLAGAAEKK